MGPLIVDKDNPIKSGILHQSSFKILCKRNFVNLKFIKHKVNSCLSRAATRRRINCHVRFVYFVSSSFSSAAQTIYRDDQ